MFKNLSKAIAGALATALTAIILKTTGIDLNVLGAGPEIAAVIDMLVSSLFGFVAVYLAPKNVPA